MFDNDETERIRAIDAALTAGLIHGMRGPIDDLDANPFIGPDLPQSGSPLIYTSIPADCPWSRLNPFNDQLCMPGPWDTTIPYPSNNGVETWGDRTSSEWRYPDGSNPFGNV